MLVLTKICEMMCWALICQHVSVDLLDLVEQRGVATLDFGDQHPRVVAIDRLIADRKAAGESVDLEKAKRRLETLILERQEMGKTLGPAHRRMVINGLRIRAITGILNQAARATESASRENPGAPRESATSAAAESSGLSGSAETGPSSDRYQRHRVANRFLQQLQGSWEVERISDTGQAAKPLIPIRLTIDQILLQDDYSDEQLDRIPADHREAFQKPWRYFTYHENLQASEFRRIVVSAKDNWEPRLNRRYVSIRDGILIVVFRENVKLLPRSIEANDENSVFYCRRLAGTPDP